MLVYTPNNQRLVPAIPNVMCLRTPSDGYVYVSKDTYDQAVILHDKYHNDRDGLSRLIGTVRHGEQIAQLREVLPEPIDILAGFMAILEDDVKFNGSIEELVGCLHVISMAINFSKFVRVNPAIRADVTFADHITREYELQWQRFINDSVPYALIYDVFARDGTFANASLPTGAVTPTTYAVAPAPQAPVQTFTPAPAITEHQAEVLEGIGSVSTGDAAMDAALANDPSLMALMLGIPEEEEAPPTAPEAPATSTDTSSTSVDATEVKSGLDALDEWGL